MKEIVNNKIRKTVVAACVAAIFAPTIASATVELYNSVESIERHPRPLGKISANGTTVFVDASIEAMSQAYGGEGRSIGIRRTISGNKLAIHGGAEKDAYSTVVVRGGKAFLVRASEMFTGTPLKFKGESVIELDESKLPGILTANAIGTLPNYDYRFYISSNREKGNWYITQDNKINYTSDPLAAYKTGGSAGAASVSTVKVSGSDLIVSDYLVLPDGLLVKSSAGSLYLVAHNAYDGVVALPVVVEETSQVLGGAELNFQELKDSIFNDTAYDGWHQWYYFKSNGSWYLIEFTADNQSGQIHASKRFSESNFIGMDQGAYEYAWSFEPTLIGRWMFKEKPWYSAYAGRTFSGQRSMRVPGISAGNDLVKVLYASPSHCTQYPADGRFIIGIGADNKLTAYKVRDDAPVDFYEPIGTVVSTWRSTETFDPSAISVSAIPSKGRIERSSIKGSVPNCGGMNNSGNEITFAGLYISDTTNGKFKRLSLNVDTNTWEFTDAPTPDGVPYLPPISSGFYSWDNAPIFGMIGQNICMFSQASEVSPYATCQIGLASGVNQTGLVAATKDLMPGMPPSRVYQGAGRHFGIDKTVQNFSYTPNVVGNFPAPISDIDSKYNNIKDSNWGLVDEQNTLPTGSDSVLGSPNSGAIWSIDAQGNVLVKGRIAGNFGYDDWLQIPFPITGGASITGTDAEYSDRIDVNWNVQTGSVNVVAKDITSGGAELVKQNVSGTGSYSWLSALPRHEYEFTIGSVSSSLYYDAPNGNLINPTTTATGCSQDQVTGKYPCRGKVNSPPSSFFASKGIIGTGSIDSRVRVPGAQQVVIRAIDGSTYDFGFDVRDDEQIDASPMLRQGLEIVSQTGLYGTVEKINGIDANTGTPFVSLRYTAKQGGTLGTDVVTVKATDPKGASANFSLNVDRVSSDLPLDASPVKTITLNDGSVIPVVKSDGSFLNVKVSGIDEAKNNIIKLYNPAYGDTEYPARNGNNAIGNVVAYPWDLSTNTFQIQLVTRENQNDIVIDTLDIVAMPDPSLDPRIKIDYESTTVFPDTGSFTLPFSFGIENGGQEIPAAMQPNSILNLTPIQWSEANGYSYEIYLVSKDANGKYVPVKDANGNPLTTTSTGQSAEGAIYIPDVTTLRGKPIYLAAKISGFLNDFDPLYTVVSKAIQVSSGTPIFEASKGIITADSAEAMIIGNDGTFVNLKVAGLGVNKSGYIRLSETGGTTPTQISNVLDNQTKGVKFPMKAGVYSAWAKHSATLSLHNSSNQVIWSSPVVGVFMPIQGVSAKVTNSQNAFAAGSTFSINAKVGVPNTISVVNDARVGNWEVWLGEKIDGAFVDIAGPVTTNASGAVTFPGLSIDSLSGKTLFLRGKAVLPANVSFASESSIPTFVSSSGFPVATAGEGGGIVTSDVTEGTLPMLAKLILTQTQEQSAVTKGLTWEYSADGGSTWIAMPVSSRGALFSPIKGGSYLVRASMTHNVTNQKIYTNAAPIVVHEKFSTTLTAPAIVLPNSEVEIKASVLNYQKRPVVPASYVLDWEVTLPGESTATTYSNVSSIKINSAVAGNALIKTKVRPVWMDAEDLDSVSVTEKTVQYGIGQTPLTEVRGPKFIESGRPATFTAKMAAPWSSKVKTDLKIEGEWEMPDGTTIPGATLTYTPPTIQQPAPGAVSAAAAINNVDLKFRSWVTGAKDQTTITKTYPIRIFNYTLPNFVLKPALDAGYAPANLLLRVMPEALDDLKMMSGHRYSYSWTIPEGATAVAKGATAFSKIDMPGTYDFVVKVDDDRGNSKEFTYSTTIEQMIPYSFNIVPRPALPFERAPMTYLLKLNITGGHPKDRIIGYTLKINDEQIGGVGTKAPAMISGLGEGTHKIEIEFMTRLGTGATASTTVNVAANQPPVCDITEQRWSGSTNVKLNAACKDNDGKIKLVTWKLDGVPVERPSPSIYLDMKDKTSVEVELNVTDDSAATTTVTKTIAK